MKRNKLNRKVNPEKADKLIGRSIKNFILKSLKSNFNDEDRLKFNELILSEIPELEKNSHKRMERIFTR